MSQLAALRWLAEIVQMPETPRLMKQYIADEVNRWINAPPHTLTAETLLTDGVYGADIPATPPAGVQSSNLQ